MPGSSPTMERRSPTSRLKSVDFPTFGRPTIATSGTSAPTAGAAEPPSMFSGSLVITVVSRVRRPV
jgi:hypothetical protein